MEELTIPAAEDFHVHLRHGAMMDMVVPKIKEGGVCRVLVMPNLTPPITTIDQVVSYRQQLQALDPSIDYLMTLYLHPDLTPEVIDQAAKVGVTGVKSYPRGVTTNSDSGIESYETYYPIFRAMEKNNLILHLHGEVPSNPEKNICVMNAEEHFLEHLDALHRDFPNLRIILEHATTKKAVDKVLSLGSTVSASITAHHLELIVDHWAGRPHHFCKPVAKYPADRDALRAVAVSGHEKFFLGSDSAPHNITTKECACGSAGVFTTPLLLPYVVNTLTNLGATKENIVKFTSANGRAFYKVADMGKTVTLVRQPQKVPANYAYEGGVVVPFLAGETIGWSIKH
eukprot:comp21989_c0_seq1/m.31788 comp21989_c0_seq1/g.31788  ORF comp21989_c0_seq1/g.31788 comp21989_c0_seq1/m.31788 type:complete len:342 (-) comp21989_c0_seq1:153-1178(-)